jgi:glycosyltransferase involved in cell wall biosynthesis
MTLPHRRLRIAWIEEWMSSLASHVLPALSQRHEIHYVTAGRETPKADFAQVVRARPWKYMNVAGVELSHKVNRLYREGAIDLAVVWASIGFGLRRVPFVNLEGGSVYKEIQLFAARMPVYRRLRFVPGLLHYVVPEMLCNRRARKVVVPSEGLKADLMALHHLASDRVDVVYHGVEDRHMALYERKKFGGPVRAVFVGRLHFRKGIADVLKAFIQRPDIDVEFLIAGDGPDREAMQAMAAGDRRVKLLGVVNRDELDALLSQTSIFVFPTYYEGFGLALIEAMASGHACVSYDIGVVREVLGDTGVLVPPGDAAGLVSEIGKLVRAPARIRELAERAHVRARRFSWEEAVDALDRIVMEAVSPAV